MEIEEHCEPVELECDDDGNGQILVKHAKLSMSSVVRC